MIRHGFMMVLGILLAGVLGACSGGDYSVSYAASGQSTNLLGVSQTDFFRDNEDLNVIVKLNEGHGGVRTEVTFTDPEDNTFTVGQDVDSDTGSVLLKLDYETFAGELVDEVFWETGTWNVSIAIDGEEVDTLSFIVN